LANSLEAELKSWDPGNRGRRELTSQSCAFAPTHATHTQREREREREKERERETDRQRETERERQRETETERQRQRKRIIWRTADMTQA